MFVSAIAEGLEVVDTGSYGFLTGIGMARVARPQAV